MNDDTLFDFGKYKGSSWSSASDAYKRWALRVGAVTIPENSTATKPSPIIYNDDAEDEQGQQWGGSWYQWDPIEW